MNVGPKGPIRREVMEAWNARDDVSRETSPPDDLGEVTGEVIPEGDTPEHRPDTGSWFARRKRERKAKAPVPGQRRVSIESIVSGVWGFGALMLSKEPRALPVARCLDMQAPVAGIVVNDVAKGTVLDRVLQPLARAGEKGGKAAGLIGPPLLVAAITYNPSLYPVIKPALRMSMMQWLEVSAPAMKKAQDRAARFAEKFGDVDIDGMIDALFAPPDFGPEQPSEDEESAIKRARQAGGE